MSFEEIIYEAPPENEETDKNIYPDDNSYFISLRSDETEVNIQTDQPVSSDNNNGSTDENDVILCALWQSGNLGAAYYSYQESELYILSDIIDLKPDFILTKNLYHQIKPNFTITLGTMASKFVRTLSYIAQRFDLEDDSSIAVESVNSLPPNVQLLKKDKYSLDMCEHAVKTLQLNSQPADLTEEEKNIYIRSLVNFEQKVSLHALGALLIFLKTSGAFTSNTGQISYLNINQITLNDLVLMNIDTFDSLKIFNTRKRSSASTVEGRSIFKLFNRCRSAIGRSNLKNLLLSPTSNLTTLKMRHEFIDFCIKPINIEIVSTIRECLSNIYPITTALNKIHTNQYTLNNWKTLYITLNNLSCAKQVCTPYVNEVQIFKDFIKEVSTVVDYTLKKIIDTIDFENSEHKKVAIKIGRNEILDQKKRYRSEIKDRITLAATYEIKNLPSYINQCSIVYIPKIGYVVAVKKWSALAQYSDVEIHGYRHQFTIGDVFNFKSSVCDELDKCLGDIQSDIEDMENNIIVELSQGIMRNSKILKRSIQTIAQFDSLICMAEVAKQLGYVCPTFTQENIIKIEDGRHPLADLLNITNFVPNSYFSGCGNPMVKIITGPNNSGKSIYLIQNVLIVYLAHIGSYVPAKSATIGLMYSIHTNVCGKHNNNNVYMSNFAIHLSQMSQSSNNCKKNSLILIDEFGRTTTELDGLALLTSFLEHYLLREELCPHILVSTHYLYLTNLIPESKFVEHLKCDMKVIEDRIVFLYKIVKGISKSFAKYTARQSGLMDEVINRSEEILKCYLNGTPLKPIKF